MLLTIRKQTISIRKSQFLLIVFFKEMKGREPFLFVPHFYLKYRVLYTF